MPSKRRHPNTIALRALMHEHGLTSHDVGALVGRTGQCVKRWMAGLTLIESPLLELLRYKLKEVKRA